MNTEAPKAAELPDSTGHFGNYGGMFVPETLMAPLQELAEVYEQAKQDESFQAELDDLLTNYCGRPTPLYYASRWTEKLGGAKIYLKREDLLHTGAHKINNAIGQILLAYMGAVDIERQAPNVARMKLLGAKVVPVTSGQATLKDAVNEAMRDWVATVADTHYILGSALGSHPFPMMVRDFHRVMFIDDEGVDLIGVEAGGDGIVPERHAARFQGGKLGVLQGTKTWLLANEDGQIELTHSVSAGLDYAAVGPEHAYLKDIGRADYSYATDDEALSAFQELSKTEGIIPALESSHALAYVAKVAGDMPKDSVIIANLSGRGDKDMAQALELLGIK